MTRNRQVTVVALVGSIMVAVGSLLPWVEIRTGLGGVTANGTEGDGVFTLIVGALMSVVAFLAMENPTGVKQRSIFTGGIVAALIAGFHVLQRGSVTILETTIPAIVGIGVWIVLVGAVVATGAATQMVIQPEPTPPASTSPAARRPQPDSGRPVCRPIRSAPGWTRGNGPTPIG
jgi:hypothetical protein